MFLIFRPPNSSFNVRIKYKRRLGSYARSFVKKIIWNFEGKIGFRYDLGNPDGWGNPDGSG